ncbi:MAG TPA: hypothetical protein VEK11_09240 [Thermoanaerobaculia bacterium]|nr:hypothetical protein [Thermoanaerobaculia bacterium]
MLQILHQSSLTSLVELMSHKLRPDPVEVKRQPQYLVVHEIKNTISWVNSPSSMSYMAGAATVGGLLFRLPSTAYPRVSLRNSTGFSTGRIRGNPQQIARFSTGNTHDLRTLFRRVRRRDFQQDFRMIFGPEKGEKQAEWADCGKAAFDDEGHKMWGVREEVHTQCGTWNNLPADA